MSKRSNPRAEHLRRALAQEAARIMSEQGIDDYGLAKRKAAERFGATDIAVLPKNTEIEAALADHQRLFESHTHSSTLDALRRTALQAMRLLKRFEPRLVGPVLSGTASEHSEINLHVFAEAPESVALHLMDNGIPHRMVERRLRYEPDRLVSYPVVRFVAGHREIEAVVFPINGIRQSPASPVDGRPMRRASTEELESMLAREPPAKSAGGRLF
jgi:predicted nucleotidyltransferase